MSRPVVEHVSDTAFLIAQARALESARPDALFSDPLASKLAGTKGQELARAFPEMSFWQVAMRTLVIDAFLREAFADGVRLVVNLGAGLDTRPYRLQLPSDLSWVEADYPGVVAYKERELADEVPRCQLERIGVDLADAEQRAELLRRLGANGRRTMVLTEGVVPYLDLEQAAALADDLRAMPGVVGWIVDYLSPESHRVRDRRLGRQMGPVQFKFRPPDWFEFFAGHGFEPRAIQYLADESKRVGRTPPLPWQARLMMKLFARLASAEQRDRFRKFAAFVWLVPS
jgi:methyltransferase (TIGR00027 family)